MKWRVNEGHSLPECPRCGASGFRRDSIFESRQEHGEQTAEFAVPAQEHSQGWLREARAMLPRPGKYLAFCEDDGEIQVFRIEPGWDADRAQPRRCIASTTPASPGATP